MLRYVKLGYVKLRNVTLRSVSLRYDDANINDRKMKYLTFRDTRSVTVLGRVLDRSRSVRIDRDR